jgi:hypothetical protein
MSEAMKDNQTANTCRELWREREDEFAGVISVDPSGLVFINYKGSVIGRPLAEWHRLALAQAEAAAELTRLRDERDRLRENMQNSWAALRMIREAIETLGSVGALPSEEAVLRLHGPEPIHEATVLVEAIRDALTASAALAQAREALEPFAKRWKPYFSHRPDNVCVESYIPRGEYRKAAEIYAALRTLPPHVSGKGETPAEKSHELVGFLAIHADRYMRDYGLNGLHPIHYDLMEKYGARMVDFKRATNLPTAPDTGNAGGGK